MEFLTQPRQNVVDILRGCIPEDEPEMSDFDSAYLCGLIKERKPKKILELEIAAGGTTSIILENLLQLGLDSTCEIHSVDLNETFYRDIPHLKEQNYHFRKSGFLAELYKKTLNISINHTFHLGKILPECIEDIGGDIDFVIMDTVHVLPGEVLDFPVLLPYLSKNATIILHDVGMHFSKRVENHIKFSYSTLALFDSVVAEKNYPISEIRSFYNDDSIFPNIACFKINPDTAKYVSSLFYSMLLPWLYYPYEQIDVYMSFYEQHYSSECVNIFRLAVEQNYEALITRQNKFSLEALDVTNVSFCKNVSLVVSELKKKNIKEVYLYCVNKIGVYAYLELLCNDIKVLNWFDKQYIQLNRLKKVKIDKFDGSLIKDGATILVASDSYFDEIRSEILDSVNGNSINCIKIS